MRAVRVPHAPEGEDTHAYSNEEVNQMLAHLPRPASVIVAVAAYALLRGAELTGLTWEDYTSTLSPRIKKRGFLNARRYKIEFISIIAGA